MSLEEANKYLEMRKKVALYTALATFLCILSPITLIILGALSEYPTYGVSEVLMGTVGLGVMFAFILCAVPLFIICAFKNEAYEFLEKNEPFELEYGVKGFVSECKSRFRCKYVRYSIVATCICIFSPIPLILTAFAENDILTVSMLAVLMVTAGVGACIFILIGIRMASMDKLLEEGDYTPLKKSKRGTKNAVGFAYWGVTVAIYLAWSFITGNWQSAVITFAVAAVMFPVLMSVIDTKTNKNSL